MRKIILLFVYLSFISGCVHAVNDQININDGARYADVYYYGFDVERITGIPEKQIEEYGKLYSISVKDFKACFSSNLSEKKNTYNSRDVRAKVIINGENYYIDRKGNVRLSKRYGTINKTKFTNSLIAK